jgi:hypothetical protein
VLRAAASPWLTSWSITRIRGSVSASRRYCDKTARASGLFEASLTMIHSNCWSDWERTERAVSWKIGPML